MTTGHASTELMADFAAGALTPGMSLLVASHLSYCFSCREKVERLEALGGAFLAGTEPVVPTRRCLEGALARIAAGAVPSSVPPPAQPTLPPPLCERLAMPPCRLSWRRLRPGLSACRLDGFPSERVGLLRAKPGIGIRRADPADPAAALVLSGRLRADDRTYGPGELKLPSDPPGAPPEAAGAEPCLCLVVQPLRPLR